MDYLKVIQGKYIMALHLVSDGGNCDEEEYNTLLALFSDSPEAPSGYRYLLRADTLEWELTEAPEDDEVDDSEALAIILGGGDA